MKNFYLVITFVLCCLFARAQNFNATLSGNPISTTGWVYPNSVSYVSGSSFVLTPPSTNQAGYIYYNTPTNLTYCADFTATFSFQISNSSSPPADGLTFFYITNPPSGFVGGGGIGMPTNPNGMVLVFDTYDNNATPANNPLISLRDFNGTGNYVEEGSFGYVAPDVFGQTGLLSGTHTCSVNYNNGTITVTLDNNVIISVNHPLTISNGYFGFTAGTGALYSQHSISNVSITGNFPPNAPTVASSTINYCQGEPATALSATGTGSNPVLLWYTVPTGGTASSTPPTPSTAVAGTYTYYVAQQGSNNCESPRKAITVNVIQKTPIPSGKLTYNYCIGDNHSFSISGSSLLWYTDPVSGVGSTVAPTISTSVPGTYNFYVTQTVNGCISDRAPVVVTVASKPAPPTITTPLRYCLYEQAIPLTAVGQDLKWYATSAGGTGTTIPPIPNTSYVDTLTWWVTQSNNGCESIRSKQDVLILEKPNGIILASSPELCQYDLDTFYYYGSADTTAHFNWHVPSAKAQIVSYSADSTMIVVKFDTAGTYPVRMQVSQRYCTSDEALYYVNVKPVPDVKLTFDKDVCVGEDVQVALNQSTANIDFFNWNFTNASILYGQETDGPYGVRWSDAGLYEISVMANANGCKSIVYKDTVDVHELPDATFGTSIIGGVCVGDSIRFTANFDDSSTYLWSPQEAFLYDNGNYNVLGTVKAADSIILTVTDKYGCVGKGSLWVDAQPCCELYMPNAFTPNGDGKNDFFGVKTLGNHPIESFRIFNRWGEVVFETADEYYAWDGTRNGVAQDVGVYFYYVKYKCMVDGEYLEKKGELTLIR